ncbi:MAG: mechanosensitive ion channel protein MscS [Rhodovulum sulfidophilum]|uniref:Mechanosensitive ion channel protein MscS n=1 Tax=Rhodovulum sulfidophilum TaxID=35806 RepID=A0A2W5N9X4_RHOSU|nr:MAG: mechanosensitive ion channel protein MscS [Rhodovulum sulfidophilum]
MRLPSLATFLALLCLWLAAPLAAQTPPAPAGTAPASGAEAAEAARLLADVIADPAAREALIAQLRAAAAGTPVAAAPDAGTPPAASAAPPAEPPAAAEAAPEPEPSVEQSITAAVAAHTLGFAEGVATGLETVWATVTDFDGMRAAVAGVNWQRVLDATVAVGVVVVATLGVFGVMRRITRGPRARLSAAMAARVGARGWARRVTGLVAVLLFDLVLIFAAWAIGYALALGIGEGGRMDLRQSLFLNAFLFVELVKLGLRLFLAPRLTGLRFWPMTDARALRVYRGFARMVEVLGYGILLAVPVARTAVSWRFAGVLELVTVLIAAWIALSMIFRNRAAAARTLNDWAGRDPDGLVGMALGVVARTWHLLAVAYVFAVLLVWSARPADSLGFVLAATATSLVAIVVGSILMLILTRAITGGVTLPEKLRERLPMLEPRLNAYVPNVLAVARLLIFVAVVGAILRAWNIFDLPAWLSETEGGRRVTESVVSAGMIILVTAIIWLAIASWIDYRLHPGAGRMATARERTLLSLLRNGVAVLLAVMTLMLALSAVGVNIAPLLAGAGVVGLAVGFGAQTLVKDIITGAFIQLENAMNTGDVVTAGGVTGTVERLTIRSVSLRDSSGTYHLVPFSSVTSIANFNKDFSYYVADVLIPRQKDVARVKEIMRESFDSLRATPEGAAIAGPFDMLGVATFSDTLVTVRARIMTRPGKHWAVGRAYNEIVARKLDAADIEAPLSTAAESEEAVG